MFSFLKNLAIKQAIKGYVGKLLQGGWKTKTGIFLLALGYYLKQCSSDEALCQLSAIAYSVLSDNADVVASAKDIVSAGWYLSAIGLLDKLRVLLAKWSEKEDRKVSKTTRKTDL